MAIINDLSWKVAPPCKVGIPVPLTQGGYVIACQTCGSAMTCPSYASAWAWGKKHMKSQTVYYPVLKAMPKREQTYEDRTWDE